MKMTVLAVMLLAAGALSLAAGAQSGTATFPLTGDWQGVIEYQGTLEHVVLHMNATPEGKMTALLDNVEQKIDGIPPVAGSFDGSRLTLRFFYFEPNASGDLEYKIATYEATVNASGDEMTGVWSQKGTWQLNFKRVTWQARNPKPAPPTIFDGDWAGIEEEGRGLELHFILHISNTEDGLSVSIDCPEEKFKGARGGKVSFDKDSRELAFAIGPSTWAGKMTADSKAIEISMTEPGYHFLIHFDRLPVKATQPN